MKKANERRLVYVCVDEDAVADGRYCSAGLTGQLYTYLTMIEELAVGRPSTALHRVGAENNLRGTQPQLPLRRTSQCIDNRKGYA